MGKTIREEIVDSYPKRKKIIIINPNKKHPYEVYGARKFGSKGIEIIFLEAFEQAVDAYSYIKKEESNGEIISKSK